MFLLYMCLQNLFFHTEMIKIAYSLKYGRVRQVWPPYLVNNESKCDGLRNSPHTDVIAHVFTLFFNSQDYSCVFN